MPLIKHVKDFFNYKNSTILQALRIVKKPVKGFTSPFYPSGEDMQKLMYLPFKFPKSWENVIKEADFLVDLWDKHEDTSVSGEYKRHSVYSKLLKKYPAMRKSEISLCIELAVYSKRKL
jgi:hypothetical protein